MSRRLHFNSCIDWLYAAWRTPGVEQARLFDIQQIIERARLAEKGLMDAMFTADFYTYRGNFSLEPITLLAAIAAGTQRIGVIASVSTTYNEPYDLARMFGSLDHLSGGRAGWNMVTTAVGSVAANYSRSEHLEHDTRYERAQEFVSVVTRLWDSWQDDAIVLRREEGVYADPARIRPIDHAGDWFSVAGPLNIPRSPQGQPVRMQAGSSQAGRDFGARWAEIIFTAQPLLSVAREFYADMKARAAAYGRRADEIHIMPGLMPILGETEAEALDLLRARHGDQDEAMKRMSELIGFDLSAFAPDETVPLDKLPAHGVTNGMRGRADLILDLIRRHRMTPRQVADQNAHHAYAGTPLQMADMITEWFTTHGCDGFTLMWSSIRANEIFVEKVIPLLQERGLYRTAYEGHTLRDHLGFARPTHPLDKAKAA